MTSGRSSSVRTLWNVFFAPSVVAIVSGVGLLSALVGDGVLDAIAWLALSLPLAIVLHAMTRKKSGAGSQGAGR